jgi:hypothetical protein
MTDRPTEIFTEGELHQAFELYRAGGPKSFWRRCPTEFIEPLLPDLDARLGDERDPAELRPFSCIVSHGSSNLVIAAFVRNVFLRRAL